MFSERDQIQFEYMKDTHRRLVKNGKGLVASCVMLFSVFGILGYIGTKNFALAICIGYLPVFLTAAIAEIYNKLLMAEYHRALCNFHGDLEELKLRLNVSKLI
ncbi:MAG: hypothetical protein RIR04_1848 [Pseudomonadota bacterium]